jgi:hypothetical protein
VRLFGRWCDSCGAATSSTERRGLAFWSERVFEREQHLSPQRRASCQAKPLSMSGTDCCAESKPRKEFGEAGSRLIFWS